MDSRNTYTVSAADGAGLRRFQDERIARAAAKNDSRRYGYAAWGVYRNGAKIASYDQGVEAEGGI